MKWLAPSVARGEPELAHNALSDCRAQAIYVARCYRALKGSPAGEEKRQETRAAAVEKVAETVVGEKSELLLFYEKLERHDWWYMMSDDGSVYQRGEAADRALRREAASSEEKAQLHKAYSEFKAGKGPKPEQPA